MKFIFIFFINHLQLSIIVSLLKTAWIGGRNKDCSSTFKWFVSESIVSSNFTNFTTFVKGSCLNTSLLWNNVVNTSSWKARNELETHAFVCEKGKKKMKKEY